MPDVVDGMISVQRPVFLRDILQLQTRGSWSCLAPYKLVTPLIKISPEAAKSLTFSFDEDVYLYQPHDSEGNTLTITKLRANSLVMGIPVEFGLVFTAECFIIFGKGTHEVTNVLCDDVPL